MKNRTRKEKIQLLRDLVAGRRAVSDLCTPPLKVFYTCTGNGYAHHSDHALAPTGHPGEVWHIEHPNGKRWTDYELQEFQRANPTAIIIRVVRSTTVAYLPGKGLLSIASSE